MFRDHAINDRVLSSHYQGRRRCLQKKEITANTQAAVKEITTFIGMLSDYYKKDKEEGLKFE